MSEMVERVAKALLEELQNIGYGVGTINAGQLSDALGRAAIKAMREPTEAMIEASDIGDEEFNVTNSVACTQEFWRTMIDAALDDPRAIAAHKGE